MGMAASQARLLSLTTRMHNVELRAQNIESQKIALATQEDEVYEKYCAALDAKKITVATMGDDGGYNYIDATFNNICGYNDMNVRQYSLINNLTGRVIVNQDIMDAYEQYPNDAYSFAWYSLGFDANFNWGASGPYGCSSTTESGQEVGIGLCQGGAPNLNPPCGFSHTPGNDDLFMSEAEYVVFAKHYNDPGQGDTAMINAYDALIEAEQSGESQGVLTELLNKFRAALYGNAEIAQEITDAMCANKNDDYNNFVNNNYSVDPGLPTDWNEIKREFEFYISLFNQIKEAGGCETIDAQYQSGEDGNLWLTNMLSSGLVSIYMMDPNSNTTAHEWIETSVATSIGNNYLQEVSDEKAVKKAEAEYEHDLKIIDRKESKLDTELKKLETEENAYKTELDSIKQIIKDNTDRTFGIFS